MAKKQKRADGTVGDKPSQQPPQVPADTPAAETTAVAARESGPKPSPAEQTSRSTPDRIAPDGARQPDFPIVGSGASAGGLTVTPPRDERGRPIGVASSERDISQSQCVAQALWESEVKYRTLFEQAADAVVVFDPRTLTILDFNDEACRRLGYTREEFAQLEISDFEVLESAEEVKQHSQSVTINGTAVFETQHRTKSGTVLDIEIRAKAICVGQQVLIQGVWRDITDCKRIAEALATLNQTLEQKVAERTQALRDSEERLQAIVSTAADAIITIDEQGLIINFSSAAERMFGYRAEEVLGQNVKVLMPEPQAEQHDGYLRRYFQIEKPHLIGTRREVIGRRKNNAAFPGELVVSELHNGQRLFVAILRDISDRKDLQAELLRSVEDEQRRIGQELHDDVQQQMTGLGLIAQSLAESLASPPEGPASLRNLQNLATRVAKGIGEANRHIHLLSRGLIPVEVDAHGLQAALQELASRACHMVPVTCRFEQEPSVQVADSFVATHLYRIAQESLNNALKHSGADRIEISLREAHGVLTLEVLDNGAGIEQQSGSTVAVEGRGLRIMAHRASLIGAKLYVGRAERGGTVVRCVLEKLRKTKKDER